jgi:hypothetical protein
MPAAPPTHEDSPELMKRKAHFLFEHAKQMEGRPEGLEGAIEMFLAGLSVDPDNIEGILGLHDVALRRKVAGGPPLGFFARLRMRRTPRLDSERVLCALKVLAYDPCNSGHALTVLQLSRKLGWGNLEAWATELLDRSRPRS